MPPIFVLPMTNRSNLLVMRSCKAQFELPMPHEHVRYVLDDSCTSAAAAARPKLVANIQRKRERCNLYACIC